MSTVNESQPTTSTTATDLASYQQFALEQQAQNNAWSAAQAQKQMDFQKEMSNTAHQREVADLQAAGLNPILSVNSGASVPNGASGDTDTSAAANVGNILQQVLQAQSAREVAGMYNAATIAAAQMAADASMYATDENNKTKREYPDTLESAIVHGLSNVQHNPSQVGSAVSSLLFHKMNPEGILRSLGIGQSLVAHLNARTRYDFLSWLNQRGYRSFGSAMKSGISTFLKLYTTFAKSYRPTHYHRSKHFN